MKSVLTRLALRVNQTKAKAHLFTAACATAPEQDYCAEETNEL